MTARKQGSAPADRVYKSSIPLKQLKFAEPKKRVKYGKQISKRIPQPDQDTLTQMDFVKLLQNIDEDDEELDGNEHTAEKRQKKRRKTEGDQPSSNSKFHTQTLTQIEHWTSTASEAQEDHDVFDVPSSPRSLGLRRRKSAMLPGVLQPTTQSTTGRPSASGNMDPPQTPLKFTSQEIPSSQSPETPLSWHSRASSTRRSPLKAKSVNIRSRLRASPKVVSARYCSPKREIEDGFSTTTETRLGYTQMTPSKMSSPFKTVRFHMPEDRSRNITAPPIAKKEQPEATPSGTFPDYTNSKVEILDSEAESDIDDQENEHMLPEEHGEDDQPETFYGNIDTETQLIAEGLVSSHDEESQILEQQPIAEEPGRETQIMESQRLSTQHMNSMAPRTGDSDVFISMHPQNVTNILDQTKDHEFRKWRLPPSVSRFWIYETSPTCTLKYMAVIGPEKHPNEIRNGGCVGNAEFNSMPRESSNYAYEILELYELAEPLPWAQLYANEWLKTPPAKWSWVRPAVLDRLMANLKPPLFVRSESAQDISASSSTDTEDAEAQLFDTMLQFADPAIHAAPSSIRTTEKSTSHEELPLPTTQQHSSQAPHPSQASTASFTESQTSKSQNLGEVVCESPTRPVRSSTPGLDLPTSPKQDYQGLPSIMPYTLNSSQLLTKSQMLPASLLSDSVPGPPLFIEDSDEEID
jgi:hypothetical protein